MTAIEGRTYMDAFSSEDATETSGTRENFTAEVVRSEPDTDEERFQTQYSSDWDIVYELRPLDAEYDNVFELGMNQRESLESKFFVLVGHLENIHGPLSDNGVESLKELAEFMEGNVYEFTDQDMTADEEFVFTESGRSLNYEDAFGGLDNPPESMLLPVRQVTDADELADLGVGDNASIDDTVDF